MAAQATHTAVLLGQRLGPLAHRASTLSAICCEAPILNQEALVMHAKHSRNTSLSEEGG